jgi:4-alpha-glucanotransferase
MLSADCWGIVPGYEDTSRVWRPTPADSRRALLAAMGVDAQSRGPAPVAPLKVVRAGEAARMFERGTLTLEDGTTLPIDDHLPLDLPLGYHEFRGHRTEQPTHVIAAPQFCAAPPKHIWGWAVQLYATRSQQSWGIGDLADLRRLAAWSKGQGAGCMLINPLNATTPTVHQQPSPYSPTSRRFRNPLYLRIDEIPGAAEALGDDLKRFTDDGRKLNALPRIERDKVFALKQSACETIWARFRNVAGFGHFRAEQGRSLDEFAIYCVLAEKYGGDWRNWPVEYRRCDSPAVKAFAREQQNRVMYYAWLQWLLDEQLARASREQAIVQDLPIGFDAGGADAWAWQDLLAKGVSVGAPPDAYAADGQDWGLPPLVPHKLRACGYRPFVETIRATLRHAGGLRIDHVMGLFRLFWIPRGMGPKLGTYVRYRADELLAILALESQRAGAFVVGEDLGTVEPGVREALAAHKILSYRVVWFEDQPPEEYPKMAMVAAATHDLPTIAGLWTGSDLKSQEKTGQPTSLETTAEMRSRLARAAGVENGAPVEQVIERTYAALARSPSAIVTAMLEDALAVEDRINMPGTVDQWPNWSLPLPGGVEAVEASKLAKNISRNLSESSRRSGKGG